MMINKSWIYILLLMVGGGFVIDFYPTLLTALVVRIGILVGGYFILRRDPFVDLRADMLFLVGLTVINILTDFGIMSHMMSNLAFIALLVWSMAGGGRRR